MKLISRKELIEKLQLQVNKLTKIKVESDFLSELTFSKFNYTIENDNLKIYDMLSDNFIDFSLNNVSFMGLDNEEVTCILNDKKDTIIKIKMEVVSSIFISKYDLNYLVSLSNSSKALWIAMFINL